MARPQPRKPVVADPAYVARLQAIAVVGQHVSFFHPAGPVAGTIVKVAGTKVTVQYATVTGPQEMAFTQRADGEYRQVGKGNQWGRPLQFLAQQ